MAAHKVAGNPPSQPTRTRGPAEGRGRARCRKGTPYDLTKESNIGVYEVAIIYAGLGEKDQAFDWLDTAFAERDKGLMYLKVDPQLDPLRSDPRFDDLLRRMNFPS